MRWSCSSAEPFRIRHACTPRQGFPPASSGLNAALLLPRFPWFPNLPCLSQRVASDRTALLSRCSVQRPN
jgi:hypothetical protein